MKVTLKQSSGLGGYNEVVELDDELAKHLIAQNMVVPVGTMAAKPAAADTAAAPVTKEA